jgi:hypothetical protein
MLADWPDIVSVRVTFTPSWVKPIIVGDGVKGAWVVYPLQVTCPSEPSYGFM